MQQQQQQQLGEQNTDTLNEEQYFKHDTRSVNLTSKNGIQLMSN